MRYNNRFFKTKEEALQFKKEHGYGALYSNLKGSRTRGSYMVETMVAYDARGERIIPAETPFCVAWNEKD